MTTDELAAQLDLRFEKIDQRFDKIDQRFDAISAEMKQGFNDSKVRDEELQRLAKLGLEANEILHEEMDRRFDAADQKNDAQITLLKDAVQHLASRK